MARLKLFQYSKGKGCYYCGAPSTTKEHAPPKILLKGLGCDSITVPACDAHNSEKNQSDRAVITGMLLSHEQLRQNLPDVQIHDDVARAIEIMRPNFAQANRELSLRHLLHDPIERHNFPLAHVAHSVGVADWMRHLTAALVWSVTGEYHPAIQWREARVWSRSLLRYTYTSVEAINLFLQMRRTEEERYGNLPWGSGWADVKDIPPAIYHFRVCVFGQIIYFHHQFYQGFSWYVEFNAPRTVRRRVQECIGLRP